MGNAGRQVLLLTGLNALAQLMGFGYRVIMARLAGAEVMGLYQLVMSAYAVIQAVTTVGLTAAMSTLTAQYLAVEDRGGVEGLRRLCLGLFFALMLPVGAVSILCSDAISVYLLGDARTRLGIVLLIPCLTLTAVENIHKNAFYGAGRPIPPAAAEVWEQFVRAAAVLGLLWVFLPQYPERAVGLVVWGMILCEISSAVTLSALYRRGFPLKGARLPPRREQLGRVWAIALPAGANALLNNALGAANSAIIPRLLVEAGMERGEAVSALGVVCGMTIPMLALPTVYLSAVNLVLMPKMARAFALKREEELRRLISGGMEGICLMTVPCMTLMGVLGEELGALLYGREDVGAYLPPLALAMGLNCGVSVLACTLNSIEGQKQVALVSLGGGAVQLGCTLTLTGAMGMGGYAAGVLACAVVELGMCLWAVCRRTGLRPAPVRWLLAPGLAGALAGSNARLLLRVLVDAGVDRPVRVGAVLVFGGGLYLLTVRVLRGRPTDPPRPSLRSARARCKMASFRAGAHTGVGIRSQIG